MIILLQPLLVPHWLHSYPLPDLDVLLFWTAGNVPFFSEFFEQLNRATM